MAAILRRTTPKAALFLSSGSPCNTDRLVQFLGGFSTACDDGIALAEFVPWHNVGGILHGAASVDPTVVVEDGTVVHSGVVLGKQVVVGSGAVVRPSVSVRQSTRIGYNVVLSNCPVGHFCTIHHGACIGQDGFGFFVDEDGQVKKKPQFERHSDWR